MRRGLLVPAGVALFGAGVAVGMAIFAGLSGRDQSMPIAAPTAIPTICAVVQPPAQERLHPAPYVFCKAIPTP